MFYLFMLSRVVKFIEIESRMVVARGWEKEKWDNRGKMQASIL